MLLNIDNTATNKFQVENIMRHIMQRLQLGMETAYLTVYHWH